ncbi:helix-turn-helix domain-containing protein [Christiangramia sp.]|uniref:helix-turn-helix domain-containing protein n=1 Tax=Christiangramia sp. TaxID=1931228 RepID=UPI0026142BEB|nr:helix-turn-helix domain-containing protein [Christiangramia sp.]
MSDNPIQILTLDQLNELMEIREKKIFDFLEKNLQHQSSTDEERLLTREEACEFLRIKSTTLWKWTEKGRLTSYGIAGKRYYKRSELLDSLIQLEK